VADFARKSAIKNWIQNMYIIPGPTPNLVIDWDVPAQQHLVRIEFTTRYLTVDLSKNLGVPAYILNSEDFEMYECEINFRPFPKEVTEYY
jgi:hypothetical protein